MEYKKLTNICSPKQWKTLPVSELLDEGFPVYGANGIIGYYSEYNHKEPVIAITCRGATCGTINITEPEAYVTGNAMCLDEVDSYIDIKYLYYCLLHYDFKKVISGSAQPQITRQSLEKVTLPIASPEEQKMIVSVLDGMKEVIDARKQELQSLDDLIKARFVEMFGTPFANEKNWATKTIGEVITEVRYGTSRPAVEAGKYPYLRMNNLTNDGSLDLNNLKRIDVPEDEVEKCVVRKGDILFNRTNSVELVGKTVLFELDEEMIIAGYIIRVRLQPCILPEILVQYMNLKPVKDLLRSMAKGAVNQANINAQELQSIKVYIPDIDLQNEFVSFKRQIYKSKLAVQQALDKAKMLFDSLMQEYFG